MASHRAEAPGAGAEPPPPPDGFHGNAAALLESAPEAIICFNRDVRYTYVNRAAEVFYNMPRERILGRTHAECGVSEAVAQECRDRVLGVLNTGQPNLTTLQWSNGRTYQTHLTRLPDDPDAVMGVVTDVTRILDLEDALGQSEARFRFIFNLANVGLLETEGPDDRIVAANDRFCQMLGYTREETLRLSVREITHPDDLARSNDANGRLHARSIEGIDYEKRYVRADGTAVWFHVRVSPVVDRDGRWVRSIATVEDIEERRRREEEQRRLTEQRQLALDAARMGWWSYDPATERVTFDERFAAIFGLSGNRLPMETVLARLHPEDQARVDIASMAAMEPMGARPFHAEYRLQSDDAGPRWVEAHGVATFSGAGDGRHAVSLLGTVQDITERKRTEEALLAADRAKDDFLAMLGHELRNPMGAIANAATLLRMQTESSPAARKPVDILERQVRHMRRLVDDLLDVSRIQRGKVALRKETVDLADVVRHCAETVQTHMTAREHAFLSRLEDEPFYMEGDAARLEQVIGNILHNAAKYTPRGGTVWLSLARDGDHAEVRVKDTGIGIPVDVLPEVFNLFVQSEPGLDRREGGLGIGLTVAKSLVEMHGGAIAMRSEGAGMGAECVIRLPLLEATSSRVRAATPRFAGLAPARAVLVVEDNVDAASGLVDILEAWGHTATAVHNGSAALAATERSIPDVVLCDIGLPGMDGYELCRALRSHPRMAATHMVALTGYGTGDDVARALRAGFDCHMTKPVDADDLLNHLASLPVPARAEVS